MATIDDLSQTSTVQPSHEVAVFIPGQGTRKATLDQVAKCVLKTLEGEPDETAYTATTDGSGFVFAVLPAAPGSGVWAQVALSGPAPAGTIILPGIDDRAHGQEVLVTCTQAVTALTVNGNGAATAGAPAAMAANGFFRLRFDSVSATWYRVG
jgi:hypothetical protein